MLVAGMFYGRDPAYDQMNGTSGDSKHAEKESTKPGSYKDLNSSWENSRNRSGQGFDTGRSSNLSGVGTQDIPTPKPKIDMCSEDTYRPIIVGANNSPCPGGVYCEHNSENHTLVAASANCTPWNLQPNGCYERVCCCDSKGQHWCERCCPDKSGKCVAYKVKC